MSAVSSWLRINRWWLVALPFAMVVVIGGSAERVKDNWYDEGLRHAVATARPGQSVTVTQHYNDANGRTSRTFTVRLSAFGTASRMPPNTFGEREVPPRGAQALVAHLDWRAAPNQILRDCHVSLIDDRGRRYELADSTFGTDDCVPPGRRGPADPKKGQPRGVVARGYQRPASWSTSPTFLVPDGIHVVEVRIWWKMPSYVALPAS